MSSEVKHRDPGPPTWIEAAEGFAVLLRDATLRIRSTADALSNYPPPLRLDDDQSPERTAAAAAFSAATAEWRHWNTYHRRYQAFIRVHPELRDASITVECRHKGACWTGDDDGFYREPVRAGHEPGDDDDAPARTFYETAEGAAYP